MTPTLEALVASPQAPAVSQPAAVPASQAAPSSPQPVGITTYGPAFFATAHPNTAFDMILRLPGFTFDAGATVRGFAGAAGNVLIDGRRPSTKTDSLDDILSRLPASGVARIELIRGAVPGIDMQGRTVLANVILKSGARTEVTAEVGINVYGDGRTPPTLQIDASRTNGDRSVSGSIGYYYEEGDEEGTGSIQREDGAGVPIWGAAVKKFDIDKGLKLRGQAQTPVLGGLLHLNAAFNYSTTVKNEQDRMTFSAVGDGSESVDEHFRTTSGEFGGDFTRKFGERTEIKLVALQSLQSHTYSDVADQNLLLADFFEDQFSGESILRGTATYTRSRNLSFEAGAEGAFNFLNGHSRYSEDGIPIALPNANVLVEERRGEAFATSTWRIGPSLNLEAGVRLESSTISQSGDTRQSESFFFPKPRVVLTWSPTPTFQTRLRLEREVGQLDFTDFVASTNLAVGSVNAGNANLQPERDWVVEAAFDKRFWGDGDVVLTLAHEALQQAIDVIPVDGLNAPGNIGDGRRDTVELAVTAPLAKLGMRGGQLKIDGKWLDSRVIDPTTGQARMITLDQPFTGSVVLTNDVPSLKSTWTVNVTNGFRWQEYRIDEVLAYRYATQVDLSWEYKPSKNLSILVQATNITNRARTRSSAAFAGLRSDSPVLLNEQFAVNFPASFFIRVRKGW